MGTAAVQGQIWGARARDFAICNEPAWEEVFERLLDSLGVVSGLEYLDLGCGAGRTLQLARQRGARVTGLDASEALLAEARQRVPDADLRLGEIEELPFADATFDRVSAINSMQFVGDHARGISEAMRVCRPGGKVAVLIWGARESSELLSRVLPPVFALLPPPAQGAPQAPQLSEPGRIEALMSAAGLQDVAAEEFAADLVFADLEAGVRSSLAAATRVISVAGEAKVRSLLETGMAPFVDGGEVRLANRFRIVIGRRP
jgi:SAM-dependent methyltransferase